MTTRQKQISAVLEQQVRTKLLQKMNKKFTNYIGLSNNRYFLKLSETECRKMGVSLSDYRRILLDLEEINSHLAEAEKESNKTTLSKMPSGRLSSMGQEEVRADFSAPREAKFIRFTCYSSATFGGNKCQVIADGARKWGAGVTKTLYFPARIDISLDYTPCKGIVTYETTSANGGFANWEIMA